LSRFLAIDADAGGIHIVAGSAVRGGAVRVEHALTVPAAEHLTPANAADLGRQLKDALRTGGIAAGPAVAAVGRERFIVKDFKIPRVSPAEEPNIVRFQASKDATEAPDAVVLDYYTLARDEPDGQVRAVTVSVRKELVAAYKALCQAAGLKLAGIAPRASGTLAALDRAIASGAVTAPEQKHASVAALTRGEKWAELIIARDGQVVFARTLSTTALNSETALLGELRRNLAVYNGQNPQQPVEAVYVAEAAGPGGWSGRIRAGLSVPVQAFDPLAGVESHTPPDARGHFAALVGLIALKAKPGRMPIDFAAPREPAAPKMGARQKLTAALGLAILIVFGALGFGYVKVMSRDAQYVKLVKQKSDAEQDLRLMEEDDKRVKALKEWDESRVNMLDELYDLTARFPDIKNAQIEQIRFEPVALQKGSKQKNVAKVYMKVLTNDEKLMNQLTGAMTADKRYHNLNKNIKAASLRGGFAQQYEIRADIERRPANEYTRKLAATAPPRPARGRDDDSGGFGGGFPGFGGDGQ
jgi:Tfp pilus assembly PilM family ATPase